MCCASLDWVFTDLLRRPGSLGAPRVVSRDERQTVAAFDVVFRPDRA